MGLSGWRAGRTGGEAVGAVAGTTATVAGTTGDAGAAPVGITGGPVGTSTATEGVAAAVGAAVPCTKNTKLSQPRRISSGFRFPCVGEWRMRSTRHITAKWHISAKWHIWAGWHVRASRLC